MLTSFTVAGEPIHVYITADEISNTNPDDAFRMSIEEMYETIGCDNIILCYRCPIQTECKAHRSKLPYYLITTYHQQWVSNHPEYFI